MSELIWIGNTLLPRGLVYAVLGMAALVIIVDWTILTDKARERLTMMTAFYIFVGILVGIPLAAILFNIAFKLGLVRFLPW